MPSSLDSILKFQDGFVKGYLNTEFSKMDIPLSQRMYTIGKKDRLNTLTETLMEDITRELFNIGRTQYTGSLEMNFKNEDYKILLNKDT